MNVREAALAVAKEIQLTPEFEALKAAHEKVQEDPETSALFSSFQNLQAELQDKQARMEEFTDEDGLRAEKMGADIQSNERILDLMSKEEAFSKIVDEVTQVILQPVQALYIR